MPAYAPAMATEVMQLNVRSLVGSPGSGGWASCVEMVTADNTALAALLDEGWSVIGTTSVGQLNAGVTHRAALETTVFFLSRVV